MFSVLLPVDEANCAITEHGDGTLPVFMEDFSDLDHMIYFSLIHIDIVYGCDFFDKNELLILYYYLTSKIC